MYITIKNSEDLEELKYNIGDRLIVTYFVRDITTTEVTLEVTDIEGPY